MARKAQGDRKAARGCSRHKQMYPCTCAMGHLYRFVEPVLLLMLKEKGRSYGYDLSGQLAQHAFTDAEIERAALYRTLRRLEENGHVVSNWDTNGTIPARRVYTLTKNGEQHLQQWAQVLTKVARSMSRFIRRVDFLNSPGVRSGRNKSRKQVATADVK